MASAGGALWVLLATSAAQALPSQALVAADVRISRADGSVSSDTQVIRFFSGQQTAQASTSVLWPLPADLNEVQGQFNAVAKASVNMGTVELHTLAAAGGTRIATEDLAIANAGLSFTVLTKAATNFAFPISALFDLDGASEIKPLADETRALAFGALGVTAEGLRNGQAGDAIVEKFRGTAARATDPRSDTGIYVVQMQTVWETNRAFNIDLSMQARAQFNGVADFWHTARLVSLEVPLGVDLEIAGVQLVRQGSQYTVFGQAAPVPEPAAWALMLGGLAGLAWLRRSGLGRAHAQGPEQRQGPRNQP